MKQHSKPFILPKNVRYFHNIQRRVKNGTFINFIHRESTGMRKVVNIYTYIKGPQRVNRSIAKILHF